MYLQLIIKHMDKEEKRKDKEEWWYVYEEDYGG